MARKKKYVPKAFESGKAGDVSANIYASMIQSRAWSVVVKLFCNTCG